MRQLLTPADVATALQRLDGWTGDERALRRTAELSSFRAAVAAIVQIAVIAEEMDHHPDIDLRWRTLHFTLSTHSAGGVTALDVLLAGRINDCLAEL